MSDPSDSRRPANGGRSTSTPLGDLLHNLFRSFRRPRNGESSLRDTLEELIEDSDELEDALQADERLLLENILKIKDVTVYDAMVPRADINAVDVTTSLDDLAELMREEGHSRVPVYRETLDDVIGMVHAKDVLVAYRRTKPAKLEDLLREVMFVAPSMRVLNLLFEMRNTRNHMALVIDEFGGIDGLVTIEDLVEEIVGEIEDEFDRVVEPQLVESSDGTLIADARVEVDDFEEMVGHVLTEEERENDIDTLGGLVFSLAGRVPNRGELIAHPSGLEFEVMDGDPRRIKRLKVRNIDRLAAEQPEE